jgi:DNA-binding response OmpR family regulator
MRRAAVPPGESGAAMDVVIAEDDELVRECLMAALDQAGLRAAGAATGEAALQALAEAERPVSVLITDLNLGTGMDGLALARRARALHPGLKVIFISGRYATLRPMDEEACFLPKPFSTGSLLAAIDSMMAGSRAPAAAA